MKRKGGQMKILSIIFMLIFSLISVSALTNITNWTDLRFGGLIEPTDAAKINNSYFLGNVTGASNVGGLVGSFTENVYLDNSYSSGNVTGASNVGGLVSTLRSSTLTNSYSTSKVYGSSSVGGLYSSSSLSSKSNVYWLNHSEDNATRCYSGGDTGCTSITNLSYFYNYSNVPMNLWDFVNVWNNYYTFVSFPLFLWQEDLISPVVTLVSPVNQTSTPLTSGSVSLMFNASDYLDVVTCTAYVEGVNYTNSSIINETAVNTINVTSLTDGTYFWYVNCTDTNLNVGQSSTWSFVVAIPVAEETSSPSSGGVLPTFNPSSTLLEKGYSISLGKGFNVGFKLGNESHSLKVNTVSNERINITVSSIPQTKVLAKGENWKVDVNADGVYDLNVFVEDLNTLRAKLVISSIEENVSSSGNSIKNNSSSKNDIGVTIIDESGNWVSFFIGILLLIILVIAGFFVWSKVERKEKAL